MMLSTEVIQKLKAKKNLLAFSAGVDSTALFFLLLDFDIPFDIAIVDYELREQSKEEVAYAQTLASSHNLVCHLLASPKINTNFEAKAREVRYSFFDSLISEFHYENLLTAHHLGDRFEWMLMQFCKGAGCAELSSMKTIEKRKNHTLIRPLLAFDKSELQNYLDAKNKHYFIDESNFDENIKRNYFRHQHAQPLLASYLEGIKKSFKYIDDDAKELIQDVEILTKEDFSYFKASTIRSDIYHIDKYFKSLSIIISAKERKLLELQNSLVISRKYIVTWHKGFVFIALFYDAKNIHMTHLFKERMRKLHIEPKLRPYFFTHLELFESLALELPLQ